MSDTQDVRDIGTRIFISHKSDDRCLALRVQDILQERCQVSCYVAGQDYGKNYRSVIQQELAKSHLLLLLFTSPGKNWDWPLYEVGLYTPRHESGQGKIVYLFYGQERPAPLEDLHGVEVDIEHLKTFLNQLYKTQELINVNPPIGSFLDDDDLHGRAVQLCSAFLEETAKSNYPVYRLRLDDPSRAPTSEVHTYTEIPRDFRVVDASDGALSIFGFTRQDLTWGDVVSASQQDSQWVDELDQAFVHALPGRVSVPAKSTFRASGDSRIFRAVLYRIDSARLHHDSALRVLNIGIVFVQESSPAVIGGDMFNLIRIGTRFRYEVIEQFETMLERHTNSESAERLLKQLRGAIEVIEREAEDFNYLSPPKVQAAFQSMDERDFVLQMFSEWENIRQLLFDAVSNVDIEQARQCIADLRRLNLEFLNLCSHRYQELINGDLKQYVAKQES